MRLHLFSSKALVVELANERVDTESQAHYLWISFVLFNLVYYSGLAITVAPLWSVPSLLEAISLIAINIFGVFYAFEASGGRSNRNFLVEFTCLYVPTTVTTLVPIWLGYWAIRIAFHETLVSLMEGHSQFVFNLARIGADFISLLTFMATTLALAVPYWRMTRALRVVQRLKQNRSKPVA